MARRREFGSTWWGAAWVEALEQSAFAHAPRLGRGRTYARQDRVTKVEVAPGRVKAEVWGSFQYRASLSVLQLDEEQWDTLLSVIVTKAAYSAELVAGSMPRGLAADSAEAGAPLLPGVGDITPDCSCPDIGNPCKHAASLCYVTADLIDSDPFVLMFLRGRGRAALIEELRTRRAVAAGRTRPSDQAGHLGEETVDAVDAFARPLKSLPNARPLLAETTRPNPLRSNAPADSGLDTAALERLAADAGIRARDILVGEGTSGLEFDADVDLVRRAAILNSQGRSVATILDHFSGSATELEAAAIAWTIAGAAGVNVALSKWTASPDQLAPARAVLEQGADSSATKVRKSGNALHAGGVQFRLDPLGQWWRFESHDRLGWVLQSGPTPHPAD